MEKPEIGDGQVETLFETKFIRVFDLQYAPGRHYYDATRRKREDLVALKTDEEFRNMLPDAVSLVVVINPEQGEPKLLLSHEFRYPAGQFLLSVPAGLIDPEDREKPEPLFETARRELLEETGIALTEKDDLRVISPFLFSTPGMTDESNAVVLVVVNRKTVPAVCQDGARGSERFDGAVLLSAEQAKELLRKGRDERGIFYSVYTWMALTYFAGDFWRS